MSHAPQDIDWDKLDKPRFFAVNVAFFGCLDVLIHPAYVLKTRLQVVQHDPRIKAPASVLSTASAIVKHEGVRGLYKGFGTALIGSIPSQVAYIGTLELTRKAAKDLTSRAGLSEASSIAVSNGAAGLAASVVTDVIYVPVDIVSQRLMAQGAGGGLAVKYRGPLDVVRSILQAEGVKGLYRGFGVSLLLYGPLSGVWWAVYGTAQRAIWRSLGYDTSAAIVEFQQQPSQAVTSAVQAAAGLIAGGVDAVVTNPLDVVKTRMQVLGVTKGSKTTFLGTAKSVYRESGLRGFYRGLGPRWAAMSVSGTAMVVTYEFLKRVSTRKTEE